MTVIRTVVLLFDFTILFICCTVIFVLMIAKIYLILRPFDLAIYRHRKYLLTLSGVAIVDSDRKSAIIITPQFLAVLRFRLKFRRPLRFRLPLVRDRGFLQNLLTSLLQPSSLQPDSEI